MERRASEYLLGNCAMSSHPLPDPIKPHMTSSCSHMMSSRPMARPESLSGRYTFGFSRISFKKCTRVHRRPFELP